MPPTVLLLPPDLQLIRHLGQKLNVLCHFWCMVSYFLNLHLLGELLSFWNVFSLFLKLGCVQCLGLWGCTDCSFNLCRILQGAAIWYGYQAFTEGFCNHCHPRFCSHSVSTNGVLIIHFLLSFLFWTNTIHVSLKLNKVLSEHFGSNKGGKSTCLNNF